MSTFTSGNNIGINNTLAGIKKSQFDAATTIPNSATLDYVFNGQNKKITYANFLSGITSGPSNRVFVNSEADFPSPVNGVITLNPNTDYFIGNTVVVTNRIVAQQGCSITGVNFSASVLEYQGTGDFITFAADEFDIRLCKFICPNATFANISSSNFGSRAVFDQISVDGCTRLITIGNNIALTFTSSDIAGCDEGIVATGTNATILSIDRVFLNLTSNSTTGINLGNNVYTALELTNLFIQGNSTNTPISGLTNSGNVFTGVVASVESCTFLGTGPIVGISNTDVRYDFQGNSGIPDTVKSALISLTGNTTPTVISAPNTPVKVAGTWVVESDSFFNCDTTGRCTYIGERELDSPITVSVSIAPASGSGQTAKAEIAVNGTVIPQSGVETQLITGLSRTFTVIWQQSLQPGQFVELFVENSTTDNVIVNSVLRIR